MTIGEIIDMVYNLAEHELQVPEMQVSNPETAITKTTAFSARWTPQALLRLANEAQSDIIQAVGAPTSLVTYADIDNPQALALPNDAQEGGLVNIWGLTTNSAGTVTGSTLLPKYTVATASEIAPAWTTYSAAAAATFVVYDPGSDYPDPWPAPPPDSSNLQDFRIQYKVKIDAMTAMNDAPFNNRWKEHHMIMVYWILNHVTQNQKWFALYKNKLQEMRGSTEGGRKRAKSLTYNAMVTPTRRRGS